MQGSLFLEASRPKTWIASISPVLIGTVLAAKDNQLDVYVFLCTLFCAIFLQIGTNLANDYFDFQKGADTKDRLGPRRVMASNLVSFMAMRKAIISSFMIASIASVPLIYQGGIVIFGLMILAILLGIGYTKGRYALAYTGLAEIAILGGFGCLAVGFSYYLQTGVCKLENFVIGLIPGFLSTSMLVLNNLRDFHTDAKAQKKTLVVRFGFLFGKLEFILSILMPINICAFLVYFWGYPQALLYNLLLVVPGSLLIRDIIRAKTPEDIIPLFARNSVYFFGQTLYFAYTLLL